MIYFDRFEGLDEDEPLHQYVVYETAKAKGPRRINLDDPNPNANKPYVPPSSLSIHLSKIDMPELQPKPEQSTVHRAPSKAPPPVAPVERLGEKFGFARNEKEGKSVSKPPSRKDRLKEQEMERQREKELVKAREREKERAREQEKARKVAEKEAKKNKKRNGE